MIPARYQRLLAAIPNFVLLISILTAAPANACPKGLKCFTVMEQARIIAQAERLLLNRRYVDAGSQVLELFPHIHKEPTKALKDSILLKQAAQIMALAVRNSHGSLPFSYKVHRRGPRRVRVSPKWAETILTTLGPLRSGQAGVAFIQGKAPRRNLAAFNKRPLRDLERLLKAQHPSTRHRAVVALGLLGSKAVTAADLLMERLERDPDSGVRQAAATALGTIFDKSSGVKRGTVQRDDVTKVIGRLLHALNDAVDGVRYKAIVSLVKVRPAPSRCLAQIKKSLHESSPSARVAAIFAAGELGRNSSYFSAELWQALTDNDLSIRHIAALALAKLTPSPEKLPLLVGFLEDKGRYSRPHSHRLCHQGSPFTVLAAKSLAGLGPKAAPAISALVKNLDNSEVREDVAKALRNMGAAAIPALVAILRGTEQRRKHRAASILVSIAKKDGRALAPLVRCFDDHDESLRRRCVGSIGHGLRQRHTVTMLIGWLGSKSAQVRLHSAETLTLMGKLSRPAAPKLVELLGDKRKIRRAARLALERIGPSIVDLLSRTLRHKKSTLRVDAARVLGSFGSGAMPARRALTHALGDRSAKVKSAAVWALGKIGPQAREAHGPILALISSHDAKRHLWRTEAIKTLGRLGVRNRSVVAALLRVLEQEDCRKDLSDLESKEAAAATIALGRLAVQDSEAHRLLIRNRKGKRLMCRVTAAWALAKLGLATLSDGRLLRRGLYAKEVRIRALSAEGLSFTGKAAQSAIPRLIHLITADHERAQTQQRKAVVKALAAVGRHAARPLVRLMLKHHRQEIRALASDTLQKIGPGAASALPLIKKLMGEEWTYNEDMMVLCFRILQAIGPKAASARYYIEKGLKDSRPSIRAAAESASKQTFSHTP